MSSVLHRSFLRAVNRNLEDCANPIQLRSYFNKYKSSVFTAEIKEAFLARISFFERHFKYDKLYMPACEELRDDIECSTVLPPDVAQSCITVPEVESFAPVFKPPSDETNKYIKDHQEFEDEKARLIEHFKLTNGNKVDVCRILNIDNEQLNTLINRYNLKPELNIIRREFRNRLRGALKD